MSTNNAQAVTDAEVATLRKKHGISSNGRGIREFTQIVSFANDVAALAQSRAQDAAPAGAGGEVGSRQAAKSDDLLSMAIGIIQGARHRGYPYTDNSPIAKFVSEAAEHLKDWPPSPAPEQATQPQQADGRDAQGAKDAADMFWNYDDAERQHGSIDEFLNEEICNGMVEVGAEFTILRGIRLPKIKIRVTAIDDEECEAKWEIIDAAILSTECGAVHDRDVNAALNIRARGLASLEAGASA